MAPIPGSSGVGNGNGGYTSTSPTGAGGNAAGGKTDAGSGGPLQNNPRGYLSGLWHGTINPGANSGGNAYHVIQTFLKAAGYNVQTTGLRDRQTHHALNAYLNHIHTAAYNSTIGKANTSSGGGGGHTHSHSHSNSADPGAAWNTNPSAPKYGNLSDGIPPGLQNLLGNIDSKYLDPRYFAQQQANSLFDPVIGGLNNQAAGVNAMMPKIQSAISQAYAPVQQSANARSGQDQAAALAAVQALSNAGQSTAAALGLSGTGTSFANQIGNAAQTASQLGQNQANQASSDATALGRDVANLKTNTTNQYNSKLNAINQALTGAKSQKAQEYAKDLISGLQLRQQLIGAALSNRGMILNQNELAQMGGLQLSSAAQGLQQAQQNMGIQAQQANQQAALDPYILSEEKAKLAQMGGATSFAKMQAAQQDQLGQTLLQPYLFADQTTGQARLNGNPAQIARAMLSYAQQLFPHDDPRALGRFINTYIARFH